MRKSLGICLLVLLLTGSAVAGEMPNLSPAPRPPQPATTAQELTNAVQEPTENSIMRNDLPDNLTQITADLLALLQSLL
jgi:hypothetical protein